MLVCIGQTPGYSMCSQTLLRPPGFSHSYYVPLQLLQTAFVASVPLDYGCSSTCSSRDASPHLLTGASTTVPR